MKHLVTGGSGFLGNLIAETLCRDNESVRTLDVWEDTQRLPEIEFVQADIRDRDKVAKALQGIDVVHHNVALVPLTKAGKQFWEVNVEGSRLIAEEAAKAGVKVFVHMSSSAIFGVPEKCPITAETPTHPIEIYGRAKLAGEQIVREVCEQNGLPLIVIRPRTILGKGRLGIFQILFDWILENKKIFILGQGGHLFQFLHADDLISAYMLAINKNKPGTYNVGTDRFGTLREALEGLIRHAGSQSRVVGIPATPAIAALKLLDMTGLSPLAPWHYLTYHKPFHFDMKPLQDLGWKAKYSNAEMLKESYDWFLQNRDALKSEKTRSAHRKPVQEKFLKLLKRFA